MYLTNKKPPVNDGGLKILSHNKFLTYYSFLKEIYSIISFGWQLSLSHKYIIVSTATFSFFTSLLTNVGDKLNFSGSFRLSFVIPF